MNIEQTKISARRALVAAYWTVPVLFCFAVYWYGLRAWFQADDFAWLRLRSEVYDWHSLGRALFAPTVHGTWRPLSERAFFLVFTTLFQFDALPFRIWVFLTQSVNLLLINSITSRVTGSRLAGFCAALFWMANSVLAHVMAWTSAYMQVLCGFFLLLAFHFLLRYIETERRRYYWMQWAVFLFGFTAMETNMVYPALAAAYTFLCARKYFRSTLPLFVPSALFVVVHMTIAPKQATGPYALHIDGAMPATFWTYWRMSLEPENLQALTRYPAWAGAAAFVLFTAALAAFLVWSARRRQWTPLFFFCWFAITLAPVVPLRDHISPYYLTLPVSGLGMLAGAGVAAAWGMSRTWKAAAALLALGFLIIQVPVARAGVKWWSQYSREAQTLVRGVVRARELHPDKTILLTGVGVKLFGGAVWDGAFTTMGVSNVYLAPESQKEIEKFASFDDISGFFLSPGLTARALARDQLVVYEVGGPRLQNVTQIYRQTSPNRLSTEVPRRVNVSDEFVSELLGPMWGHNERTHRWMPKSAVLQIGGPRSPAEKLRVSGYCPAFLVAKGPVLMTVRVPGKTYPAVAISKPDAGFDFVFPLPAELVGKPSIEVGIEVDRTTRPPGENRDMGLAFGVFEIR